MVFSSRHRATGRNFLTSSSSTLSARVRRPLHSESQKRRRRSRGRRQRLKCSRSRDEGLLGVQVAVPVDVPKRDGKSSACRLDPSPWATRASSAAAAIGIPGLALLLAIARTSNDPTPRVFWRDPGGCSAERRESPHNPLTPGKHDSATPEPAGRVEISDLRPRGESCRSCVGFFIS